ncbi:hypothetical protein [Synechococcus elongatus]|uniref:hypothetical protein n=1 Tax=Synechococcus elongatus TaxID=32046 RepID=UPI0030D0CD5D
MTDINQLREIVASNAQAIADSLRAHTRSVETLSSGLHQLTQSINRLTGDIRVLERAVEDMVRSEKASRQLWEEEKKAIATLLLQQEKRLQLIEKHLFNIEPD